MPIWAVRWQATDQLTRTELPTRGHFVMDDKRFDSITRAFASGASRRSLLKGLLGLGGAALTGAVVLDDGDSEAARRPTPTPKPPTCPGQQTWVSGKCVCPAGLSQCIPETGPACCNDQIPPGSPGYSMCCDNACCQGTCYGEELCCQTNNRPNGLPPLQRVCDTNDGEICCPFSNDCCIVDGCCPTVCFGGPVDADFCCSPDDFCPGGSESPDECCSAETTCCGANTNGNACVDLDTDDQNCGACGNVCTGCSSCQNGQCVPDDEKCDGDLICCPDGNTFTCEEGPFCGCDVDGDCPPCNQCVEGTCVPLCTETQECCANLGEHGLCVSNVEGVGCCVSEECTSTGPDGCLVGTCSATGVCSYIPDPALCGDCGVCSRSGVCSAGTCAGPCELCLEVGDTNQFDCQIDSTCCAPACLSCQTCQPGQPGQLGTCVDNCQGCGNCVPGEEGAGTCMADSSQCPPGPPSRVCCVDGQGVFACEDGPNCGCDNDAQCAGLTDLANCKVGVCNAGVCETDPAPAGTICHAAGPNATCDPQVTCNGQAESCPGPNYAPEGTDCGACMECNGAGLCLAECLDTQQCCQLEPPVGDVCIPTTETCCDAPEDCAADCEVCNDALHYCVSTCNVDEKCCPGTDNCVPSAATCCDDNTDCSGLNFCTGLVWNQFTCGEDGYCVGTSIDCNDGDLCTNDACNAATGCSHTPVQCTTPGNCFTLPGTCNPADGQCDYIPATCPPAPNCFTGPGDCDPADGECDYTPVVCNTPGVCQVGPGTCNAGSGLCEYQPLVCDANQCLVCVNSQCVNNCPSGTTCNGSGVCVPNCTPIGNVCASGATCCDNGFCCSITGTCIPDAACCSDNCNGPNKCCCYNPNGGNFTCSDISACQGQGGKFCVGE
jgi:hypothetical protein